MATWPSAVITGRRIVDDSAQIAVVSPLNGQVIASVPMASATTVDDAVRAARAAFPSWSRATPAERQQAMDALAGAIEADAETLTSIEVANTGKPRRVAAREVLTAARQLRYYAGAARSLEGRAAQDYVRGRTSLIRREPVGVIGQITPWNYPLVMAIWKIGPALAAGNTVVLKPSELTPLSTLRLAELAAEALPPGALNVVAGDGETTGQALTTHPGIDMLCVTGSVETGRHVLAAAAASIKRSHVELGGNAPVLVFDDADLDLLAGAIRTGAFWNSGQDCTAATRLIVHESVHDEVVERLIAEASSLRIGGQSADDTDYDLGPLISSEHRDRVAGFVERAVADGARLRSGGRAIDGAGFFFEPTVLSDVEQSSEIVQQEVFGPVITVQRFRTEDEALEYANGTEFGLSASVWTRQGARALRVANRIETGVVWINDHLTIGDETPHGGRKRSGFGKDLSTYAIEDYTVVKHIMIRTEEERA